MTSRSHIVATTTLTGLFAALSTVSSTASAQDEPVVLTAEEWYGAPILLTTTGAIAFAVIAVTVEDAAPIFAPAAFLTYLFGGPIVHLAHEEGGRALASFGLNVGIPIVTGLLGVGLFCGISDGCDGQLGGIGIAAGLVLGASVGVIAAVAVDTAVLARRDAPVGYGIPAAEPNAAFAPPAPAVFFAPSLPF